MMCFSISKLREKRSSNRRKDRFSYYNKYILDRKKEQILTTTIKLEESLNSSDSEKKPNISEKKTFKAFLNSHKK